MLNYIRGLFRGETPEPESEEDWGPLQRQQRDGGKLELRRWQGAKPGVNQNSYVNATGRNINQDLHSNLRQLLVRCQHEATTNGTIDGLIDSHCLDTLGPDGPSILVLPRNPAGMPKPLMEEFAVYQRAAEEYLEEWAICPDVNAEMSFIDILGLEIGAGWTTGNSYTQIVSKQGEWDKCVGDIRLHPIHAERVLHSYQFKSESDNSVFLGHEINKFGKTLNYFVQEVIPHDMSPNGMKAERVPFQQIIHGFRRREPGQIAGVPLLAPVLDDIASLRRFDELTLNAASSAASLGVVFQDAFDGVKPVKGAASGRTESVKMNGAAIIHAPSGKKASTISSEHPASNYVQFRTERWKDVGRVAQAPKLITRLDATGLSYSASRMEQQLWNRGIRRGQQVIKRRYSPTLSDVLREAELEGRIPMRPVQIEIGMTFSAASSADPSKDAKTRTDDLKSLSKSLLDVWAECGLRPRDQIEKMRRSVDMLNEVSPGLGERYMEQLIASKPDSIEATAMAGDDLPDGDIDDEIESVDAMAGEVVEQ